MTRRYRKAALKSAIDGLRETADECRHNPQADALRYSLYLAIERASPKVLLLMADAVADAAEERLVFS